MKEQKTHSKAEAFSGMFRFQECIFNNALENLTEDLALRRASNNSNHMNWLLGHVLHCRFMLAGMIGLSEINPFGKTYWTAIDDKPYPPVNEISGQLRLISKKLIEKLSSIPDEEMDAKPGVDQSSLADIISFFAYHEAYHLGQIGIVRKMIGLSALKSS